MSIEDIPEPDAVSGALHPRHTLNLYGQTVAEQAFIQAFRGGRLHNGWLICGPRGVGKATLAWRIARFLLCQPSGGHGAPDPSLDVAGEHPVIRRVAALSEPRLFLCRRPWDAKTERLKTAITVDEVRRLKSFFNLSAADGGRRVVIIDTVDEMNNAAANALLKVLEEPPEKCTLLLVSHSPMRLLPTIRSRCRTLQCASLSGADLGLALAAAGFDAGTAPGDLAVLAGGSVGEAIRVLSGNGLEIYASIIAMFARGHLDRRAAIALAEGCTGKQNAPRYDLVLRLVSIFLHRLALAGVSGARLPGSGSDEAAVMARLSPSATAARHWADLAQILSQRSGRARAVNLDPASVILDMLIKVDQVAGSLQPA